MNAASFVLLLVVLVLLLAVLLAVMRGDRGSNLAPFQQQLVELRRRIDSLVMTQQQVPRALAEGSAEQLKSLSNLHEELVRLSEAAGRLETVGQTVAQVQELLKVPRLRGTLGELWLEELLRQVFPSGSFELQYGFKSGERVDAVLRLGDRLVPVDSKFPLEACQRMLGAEGDEAVRERRAFQRALRSHIDEIHDKYIRPDEGTYEFALMYIPAENVYYEAVIRDEELDDESSLAGYALNRKVIPVSPNTFYAYLAAILHGLRGMEVEQSAREILESLGGLQQQFGKFKRAYELVHKHLANALKQYNEADGQLAQIHEHLDRITGVSVDQVSVSTTTQLEDVSTDASGHATRT